MKKMHLPNMFRSALFILTMLVCSCISVIAASQIARSSLLFLVFDDLRHLLHNLLVEGIQGIPDGLEEVRGAAGVVPVPGGH